MATAPPENDPVQDRARRLSAELRSRRLAAELTQQALADRIAYDRSYLSQVQTGAHIPAEQFILQCERELAAGGELLGMFRELLAEREASRPTGPRRCCARAGRGGRRSRRRAAALNSREPSATPGQYGRRVRLESSRGQTPGGLEAVGIIDVCDTSTRLRITLARML